MGLLEYGRLVCGCRFLMITVSKQIDLIWDASQVACSDLCLESFLHELCNCLELGKVELSVLITNDERVRGLNRDYRGKDVSTDVLSFPAGPIPMGDGHRHLGDLVVSYDRAAEQARAIGQSVASEIRFLCLHGLLHLLGYDHETDNGEMLHYQKQLKKKLNGFF